MEKYLKIMGEKEFFDKMKKENQYLSLQERWLLSKIVESFTYKRKDKDE